MREIPASIRIRAARVDDAPAIASIQVAGWRRAYRGILPDAFLDAISLEAWTARGRRFLESPPRPGFASFVAEGEGAIAGMVMSGPSRDADAVGQEIEVYAIYVHADHVGTGVGRALLSHAIADASGRGFGAAALWVFEANGPARRFYEKAGFSLDASPAGRRMKSFGTPPQSAQAPEVRYRRAIS